MFPYFPIIFFLSFLLLSARLFASKQTARKKITWNWNYKKFMVWPVVCRSFSDIFCCFFAFLFFVIWFWFDRFFNAHARYTKFNGYIIIFAFLIQFGLHSHIYPYKNFIYTLIIVFNFISILDTFFLCSFFQIQSIIHKKLQYKNFVFILQRIRKK